MTNRNDSPQPNRTPRITDILNRRLTRREILAATGILAGVPTAASIYGFGIEPRRVVVEEIVEALPGFPGNTTAVLISDIHFRGPSRHLERVARAVNEQSADLLFVAGDLTESRALLEPCLRWLSSLRCRDAAYFSPGNWDRWSGNLKADLGRRLAEIGIRMLNNEGVVVDRPGGSIFLSGIDDAFYGEPDFDAAMAGRPDGMCTIVLSHAPCVVHRLDAIRTDLILSGHTHGGQVRLPGIGAPITPPGSAEFVCGCYLVRGKRMYVTRGIGTSILPVRINCPPEVTRLVLRGA